MLEIPTIIYPKGAAGEKHNNDPPVKRIITGSGPEGAGSGSAGGGSVGGGTVIVNVVPIIAPLSS